jgi:hypothetical protein
VDYCGELTHVFGAGVASRYFKTTSTGPYLATCTCQAKGKRGFGRDVSYLCTDRDTGTVIAAKVARKEVSGQTFNVSADVQSSFVCVPTPSCDVRDVIDAELEPENGTTALAPGDTISLDVEAGGSVDLGYIGACGGYASEAPTLAYDVPPSPATGLSFQFTGAGTQGVLVPPLRAAGTATTAASRSGPRRAGPGSCGPPPRRLLRASWAPSPRSSSDPRRAPSGRPRPVSARGYGTGTLHFAPVTALSKLALAPVP